MKQHKWHKEIKAWADGAEIEKWVLNDTWQKQTHPAWHDYENYRIKPQPKEPRYLYVYKDEAGILAFSTSKNSYWFYKGKIKLEVDDE